MAGNRSRKPGWSRRAPEVRSLHSPPCTVVRAVRTQASNLERRVRLAHGAQLPEGLHVERSAARGMPVFSFLAETEYVPLKRCWRRARPVSGRSWFDSDEGLSRVADRSKRSPVKRDEAGSIPAPGAH